MTPNDTASPAAAAASLQPTRPADAGSSRAQLVAAATDLFYRSGVRAVSVEHIVAAANTTKMTLYRYFRAKDDLVVACVSADGDRIDHELTEIIAAAGPNPADGVRAIVRRYAKMLAAPPARGLLAINAAIEFPDAAHPVREAARLAAQNLQGRLHAMICEVAPDRAEAMSARLVLMILGACTACQVLDGAFATRALIETTEALLANEGLDGPFDAPPPGVVWV